MSKSFSFELPVRVKIRKQYAPTVDIVIDKKKYNRKTKYKMSYMEN